jgi:two-component system, OmpR family, response regulator
MRILVIDDEPEMLRAVARGLADDGHDIATAADGIEALKVHGDGGFDAAIVDVMLPGMSGFELTKHLKERQPGLMVILLTARDAVDDRVRGLDSGADDYMTKPFHLAELTARIRAIQRRDALAAPRALVAGRLTLDLERSRARVGDREVALSRTEFDVLRVFVAHLGAVVSRQLLLDEVWDSGKHIDANVVDQYLSYVRRKLAEHEAGVHITTQRGVGFTLVEG